jgi:hypothetical protein
MLSVAFGVILSIHAMRIFKRGSTYWFANPLRRLLDKWILKGNFPVSPFYDSVSASPWVAAATRNNHRERGVQRIVLDHLGWSRRSDDKRVSKDLFLSFFV